MKIKYQYFIGQMANTVRLVIDSGRDDECPRSVGFVCRDKQEASEFAGRLERFLLEYGHSVQREDPNK